MVSIRLLKCKDVVLGGHGFYVILSCAYYSIYLYMYSFAKPCEKEGSREPANLHAP